MDCVSISQMTASQTTAKRSLVLTAPRFRTSGKAENAPTLGQTLSELFHALNFIANPTYKLLAFNFFIYTCSGIFFVHFVLNHASMNQLLLTSLGVVFLGTVYNSFWFHRYCCHSAFRFTRDGYARLFLWTNPLAIIFREEVYAIPHHIHHEQTEKPIDPYGPHLGWLASFLAAELTQRINTDVTEHDYDLLKASIHHIGIKANSYEDFLRTGAIENVTYYFARVGFAQIFWLTLIYTTGGITFLMAWYASYFAITSLIRDFNWRGHGGRIHRSKIPGWEFDQRSYALNQRFYGYIASEWHDNHHRYPASANNGFLPGQIDIAFRFIRVLSQLGIVRSYTDLYPRFKEDSLRAA